MSRDPLELFVAPNQPPASQGNGLGWLVAGLLLGFAIFFGWQRYQGGGFDRDGDGQEQRETKVDGKTLVFIHERNPQPIEHDLLLREMPEYCEQHGLEFRAFDDDLNDDPIPQLLTYAATKGVTPPLVVLIGKDDKPASAIEWPPTTAGLEALFQ